MPRVSERMRMPSALPVIAGLDPAIHRFAKKLFAKRMDHPKSGLPDFGHFKCASRMNPTCVVKPAGDANGASESDDQQRSS
jgi:hypothetical protein